MSSAEATMKSTTEAVAISAGNCINAKASQGTDSVGVVFADDELGCGYNAPDQVGGDTPSFVSTSSFAEVHDTKADPVQTRNEKPMLTNGVALIAPIATTTVFGFDRKLLLCRRFKDSDGILRNFNSLPLFLYATSNTTHAMSADGVGVGREVSNTTTTTLGGMNDSYHLALCAGSINDSNAMNCLPLTSSTLDANSSNITLHPMTTTDGATTSAMVAGAAPSIAATLYQQHLNLNHHHHHQLLTHHTPYANNHPYHLHNQSGNQLLNHQHVHTEQTKSLQELQHEVGALLEFRDLVIETFPDLKHKMASMSSSSGSAAAAAALGALGGALTSGSVSGTNTLTAASGLMSGTSTASRRDWEPGIRIKRKLSQKDPPSNTTAVNSATSIGVGVAAVPPVVGELSSSSLSRSRSNSHSGKKEPKSGENNNGSVVQDSGFSTETSSSKEGHSASSTNGALTTAIASNRVACHESDDELMNLLDVIHRKSSRLRDEVDRLQSYERQSFRVGREDVSESSVQSRALTKSASAGVSSISSGLTPRTFREHVDRINKEDIKQLRKERDRLLEKLAEMEAETLTGRIKTAELSDQVVELISVKKDLEEQLKLAMAQKLELSSRLQQLQQQSKTSASQSEYSSGQRLNFLSSAATVLSAGTSPLDGSPASNAPNRSGGGHVALNTFQPVVVEQHVDSSKAAEAPKRPPSSFHQSESSDSRQPLGRLDGIVSTPGGRNSKCRVTDSKRFQAILLETNVLELQRHLLTLTVQNQVLTQKLEQSTKSKAYLAKRLDRSKDDVEDLRFQLEEKNIELEGTKAQLRVLESRMHSSTTSAATSYTHSQNDYEANRSSASTTLMLSRRGDPHFGDSRSSTPISATHMLPTSTPTQISTPSMKAMTHIPMDEVQQHSSSTESTHDLQQELPQPTNKVMSASVGGTSPFAVAMHQQQSNKRPAPTSSKPSKIPLPGSKSTTFFPGKPPTGRPYAAGRSPPSANTSTGSHTSTSSSSKSSLSRSTGNLMCLKSSSSLKRTDSAQSIRREAASSLSTNTSRSSTSSIPMPTASYSTRTATAPANPSPRVLQNSPLPKPKRDSLTSRVRHLDSLSRVHQQQSHTADTNCSPGGGSSHHAATNSANGSGSYLLGSAPKPSCIATQLLNTAARKDQQALSSSSFSHGTQQFLRRATGGSAAATNTTSSSTAAASTSTLSTMRRFSSASTMGRRIPAPENFAAAHIGSSSTNSAASPSSSSSAHSDQHNIAHSTDSDSGKRLSFLNYENNNRLKCNNNNNNNRAHRSTSSNPNKIVANACRPFMAHPYNHNSKAIEEVKNGDGQFVTKFFANSFACNEKRDFSSQSQQLDRFKNSSNNYFKNIKIIEKEEVEEEQELQEAEDEWCHHTESYRHDENKLIITFDYGFNDSIGQQQFNEKKSNAINTFMRNNNDNDDNKGVSDVDDDDDEEAQLWLSTSAAKCSVEQFPVHRMRHNIKDSDISFLSTLIEYDVDDGEEVRPALSRKLHPNWTVASH